MPRHKMSPAGQGFYKGYVPYCRRMKLKLKITCGILGRGGVRVMSEWLYGWLSDWLHFLYMCICVWICMYTYMIYYYICCCNYFYCLVDTCASLEVLPCLGLTTGVGARVRPDTAAIVFYMRLPSAAIKMKKSNKQLITKKNSRKDSLDSLITL